MRIDHPAVAALIDYCEAQRGKPYGWGATGPTSYDCSGLIYAAFRDQGRPFPGSARTAEQMRQESLQINREHLVPGTLVFFHIPEDAPYDKPGEDGFIAGHVGLVLDPGGYITMIDAKLSRGVTVETLQGWNYQMDFRLPPMLVADDVYVPDPEPEPTEPEPPAVDEGKLWANSFVGNLLGEAGEIAQALAGVAAGLEEPAATKAELQARVDGARSGVLALTTRLGALREEWGEGLQ